MAECFSIQYEEGDGYPLFSLSGNIDAQAEALLKSLPERVNGPTARLDFGNAGRINSMGIAFLLRSLKAMKESGCADIRFRRLNQTNTILFRMTGLFLLGKPET